MTLVPARLTSGVRTCTGVFLIVVPAVRPVRCLKVLMKVGW